MKKETNQYPQECPLFLGLASAPPHYRNVLFEAMDANTDLLCLVCRDVSCAVTGLPVGTYWINFEHLLPLTKTAEEMYCILQLAFNYYQSNSF